MSRRYPMFFMFAMVLLLGSLPGARAAKAAEQQCFTQTNQCITGRFLQFWQDNGGLSVFGYPITAAHNESNRDTGKSYLTQWFERNRFEYHPENQPPYDVLLGRLGDDALRAKGINWQQVPRDSVRTPGCLFFPQTTLNVCNQSDEAGAQAGFMNYWQTEQLKDPRLDAYNRSLALFGLPITRARMETNSSGDTVWTQWFERARLEWHPNNPPGFRVQLGLLGNELQHPQPAVANVLYVNNGALYELQADGTSVRRQGLNDLGKVLDAVQFQGQVIVLCERGLQKVGPSQAAQTIATFSKGNATFGRLDAPANSNLVIYSYDRASSDGTNFAAIIGVIQNGTAVKVFEASNNLLVLGVSTDEKALYVIDQGSDPSFNHVRVIQIPNGETLATLPFSGVGAVAESPDRLTIAAADQPSFHPNIVKLYNLANPSAAPRVVTMPRTDWNAFELVWSRDSRQVYVAMFPSVDNPKGELYRIDAGTGATTLVASNLPIDTRLLSVTADGRQILAAQQDSVDLIDLASGGIQRRSIPAEAIIAHIN